MAEEKKADDKKKAAVKRPTPLKRDIQNEKKRLQNRSFRASVMTAIRALDGKDKLGEIYSLVDKGVKRGIFKANKAARIKSRLTARVSK